MCGIAGMMRMRDAKGWFQKHQVQALVLGIRERGFDATGIALVDTKGDLHYHKDDSNAVMFMARNDTNKFLDEHLPQTEIFIAHTRAWTKGSPHRQENNHPLTKGRTAVVHNGVLWNDDELFSRWKLERSAETDSDIIRAILDEEGLTPKAVKKLREMRGSAAFAAIELGKPETLMLARCQNPLVVAMLEESGFLLWASTKSAIHAASKRRVRKYGLEFQANSVDLTYNPFEPDSCYIFNKDGECWTGEFRFSQTSSAVSHHAVHARFAEKNKRKNAEKTSDVVKAIVASGMQQPVLVKMLPEMVKCLNPSCTAWVKLSEEQRRRPAYMTKCSACEATVGMPPKELMV